MALARQPRPHGVFGLLKGFPPHVLRGGLHRGRDIAPCLRVQPLTAGPAGFLIAANVWCAPRLSRAAGWVKLRARSGGVWHERGVVWQGDRLAWADRPTDLRPPVEIDGTHDYLTEIHPQAQAFMRTLADRLTQGAAFFLDYGFPEAEYFHPQRHMGTLMCHRGHRADPDPLADVGLKDLTAHVDFTGVALAGQYVGLPTPGYPCLLSTSYAADARTLLLP